MDCEMARDHGKKEWATAIDTMETIETIKNGDMECLLGQLGMFIKEIIKQI